MLHPLHSLLFCALIATSLPLQAQADSLTDSLGPKALALGEAKRAEAIGATSISLNPAGLALNKQLVFDVSYGYRDTDKASILNVSGCDSTTPIAGCFYYRYLTASPGAEGMETKRRFHEAGFTAARALTQSIAVGTNTRFFDYNSQLTGEEDVRGVSLDVGAVFQGSPHFGLGATLYNVVGTDSPQYPRGVGGGISVRPGQGALALSFDSLWNLDVEDIAARYGGGVEYVIQTGAVGYPLRVGGVYDNGSDNGFLTIGVGYLTTKLGLEIGARKQVSGIGSDLIIQAGLRIVAPTAVGR